METPATYTATPSSTSAGDLLGQIQTIIDERDAYKAKCARQGAIIAKLADMMGELQAFIDEAPQGNGAETPAVTAAPEPTPTKTFSPDAETIAGWAAEYDAGTSCEEIAKRYGVTKYRIAGHISRYRRQQRDAEPETPEPEAEPEPATANDPALDYPDHDDDTIAEWVRLIDAGRTAEQVADRYGEDPYRVRGLVRSWREEHGETVKAFEAA